MTTMAEPARMNKGRSALASIAVTPSSPRNVLFKLHERGLKHLQNWPRIQTQPQQGHHHHTHHDTFTQDEVPYSPLIRIGTIKSALHNPQCIKRCRQNADT